MATAKAMAARRSSEYYRQEAERCQALAQRAKSPIARASLASVAQTYEDLARQVEELDKYGYQPAPDSK